MTKDPKRAVAEWLASCQTRFKNMYDADLDKNGWPRLEQAMKNFDERGYFTVGEIQYLFNRTHHMGGVATYNKHRGYNKRYGDMLPCPLPELIDSGVVNWPTGKNGVIQDPLARAIKKETRWEWRMGDLRPQQNTSFGDLFGA